MHLRGNYFSVGQPESPWRGSLDFAELLAEVITVIKSAAGGNFSDGAVAVDQQIGRMLNPNAHQIVYGTAADIFFKMPVETSRRHMGNPGKFFDMNRFCVMAIHIADSVSDQEGDTLFGNPVSAHTGDFHKDFHKKGQTVKKISGAAVLQLIIECLDHTNNFTEAG